MTDLKKVLMERDEITGEEADEQISNAYDELMERIGNGEDGSDFMMEEFGLEPDYLEDLIL